MVERNIIILNTTISNGYSITSSIDMSAFSLNKDNYRLVGIKMPDTWTAANLTFQVSVDDGASWNDLYDAAGTEYSVTASSSRYIILDPSAFCAISNIKIRSGSSASPVTQGGDRSLSLVLRGV